jgi:hypothetical protein
LNAGKIKIELDFDGASTDMLTLYLFKAEIYCVNSCQKVQESEAAENENI